MQHYIQHEGKVIETNDKYKLVMAIALDSKNDYKTGVVRCITSREGDVTVSGYVDRSELHALSGESLERFKIGEQLKIRNTDKILDPLIPDGYEFIGLEDPDIWIDPDSGMTHLYFTLPFLNKNEHTKHKIHIGHAFGKDLDNLEMSYPVLLADDIGGAKELSVAPINLRGCRYNLVESSKKESDFNYSVIRQAITNDMGESWKFGEIIFHPKEHGIPWIGGHASPGPLFSKNFIDVGEGKLLGVINGREANTKMPDGSIKYGMFAVGLFIYDYEKGKIDWVSPEPLIQDTEAITITFASQFIETATGEGILYAHVDDSFVRAYTLKSEWLKELLP